MLQSLGLVPIDQRLDDVGLALLVDEQQRAPAALVDDLDVRVLGADFMDRRGGARRQQQAQREDQGANELLP